MRLDRWGSSVMSHRKSDGSCAFVAGKGVSPLGITVLWSCGEDFLGGRVSAPPYLEKSVRARLTMVDIRKRTRMMYPHLSLDGWSGWWAEELFAKCGTTEEFTWRVSRRIEKGCGAVSFKKSKCNGTHDIVDTTFFFYY